MTRFEARLLLLTAAGAALSTALLTIGHHYWTKD